MTCCRVEFAFVVDRICNRTVDLKWQLYEECDSLVYRVVLHSMHGNDSGLDEKINYDAVYHFLRKRAVDLSSLNCVKHQLTRLFTNLSHQCNRHNEGRQFHCQDLEH